MLKAVKEGGLNLCLIGKHGLNICLDGRFNHLELLRFDLLPFQRAQHGGAVAAEANTRPDNGQGPHLNGRGGCGFSGEPGEGFGQRDPQRRKTPVYDGKLSIRSRCRLADKLSVAVG